MGECFDCEERRFLNVSQKMELAIFLSVLLSKEEFKACYSLAWVGQAYDCYGTEQMTPMERDDTFESFAKTLLFGMRVLALAGYHFENFDCDDDGVPRPKENVTRYDGNRTFVGILSAGGRYDYLSAVEALQELIAAHNLSIDRHPIKQARSEIISSLDAARKDMTAEDAKAIIREKRKRMAVGKALLERTVN